MIDPADTVLIEQVIRRSADCNDRRAWHELAVLYDVDGTLTRPNGQRAHGREEIEAAYAAGPPARRTRHVCSGPVIEFVEPGVARAVTPVLLFTWEHSDGPGLPSAAGPAIGEFTDVLVRTDTGWLIRERAATLSARAPAPAD